MKIDHILILADDDRSVKAIEFGFNLAGGLGAKVTILSVIENAMSEGNTDAGIFPDDALIAIEKKTADFLVRVKNNYGGDVNTEVLVRKGQTLETTMGMIKSLGIDLVVAASHTRHGLNKLFGKSLPESIVHHSAIPVCIVPID